MDSVPFLAFVLELLSAVGVHVAADTFVNGLHKTAAAKRIEVSDLNNGSDDGQPAMLRRYSHMAHARSDRMFKRTTATAVG